MNKVIQAELKKIVSKPGIYILAVLLALIMLLGVFIYKPSTTTENTTTLNGTTVLQVYQDDFGDGVNTGIKASANKMVTDAKNAILSYKIDGVSYAAKLEEEQNKFEDYFNDYSACGVGSYPQTYVETAKTNMLNSFQSIYSIINAGLNLNANGAYPIVTTKANYDEYDKLYSQALELLQRDVDASKITEVCADFAEQYMGKINACINKLYYSTVNEDKVKNYTTEYEGSNYKLFTTNINKLLADIETIKEEAQLSNEINANQVKIEQIKNLVMQYDNYCQTYANLIEYDLMVNVLNIVKTADQGKLLYLESATSINANSYLVKYDYLFKHNKSLADFANPLTIGISSNQSANGYDYAFFILKMFSFVIIAYAIMAGAHTISGEIKEGTMRYLAIRPVKRSSILFGKYISIAIISIILILFSGVLSIIVGGCIYGFNSLTILTVFAGKYAITLHPIAMIAIYLLSLILELLVYLSIAVLLSNLIKSDILAVTILMVVYLINILLPMFTGSAMSWLAYYPFSHISLYSLFGSALFANPNNPFNMLLGTKVYTTTSLPLTLLTVVLIIALCNIIASKIFKHKEI